jgi:outer membrane protein OmpA-like peptidoglycan-associated protein
MGSLETGIKWNMCPGINLYTGLYVDYAFNNVVKEKNDKFVVQETFDNGIYGVNSILTSSYNAGSGPTCFADKVNPLTVDFKLRLGFTLDSKNDTENKLDKTADFHTSPCDHSACCDAVKLSAQTTLKALDIIRDLSEKSSKNENESSPDENKIVGKTEKQSQQYNLISSRLGYIYYDVDVSKLTGTQERELDEYIVYLTDNPTAKIDLIGHACDMGDYKYNMRLGQERANAVREYLVRNGIEPDRINAYTRGDTEPDHPINSDANRKKNRRLEVQIIR